MWLQPQKAGDTVRASESVSVLQIVGSLWKFFTKKKTEKNSHLLLNFVLIIHTLVEVFTFILRPTVEKKAPIISCFNLSKLQ